MKNSYVLDSSALLVLINKEPGYEKMYDYLQESCMSTVNVSEVASILHSGVSLSIEEIQSLIKRIVRSIIPFDEGHAYQTAELRTQTKHKGLSLGDRACIALAKMKNSTVITADKIWISLDLNVKMILIR